MLLIDARDRGELFRGDSGHLPSPELFAVTGDVPNLSTLTPEERAAEEKEVARMVGQLTEHWAAVFETQAEVEQIFSD